MLAVVGCSLLFDIVVCPRHKDGLRTVNRITLLHVGDSVESCEQTSVQIKLVFLKESMNRLRQAQQWEVSVLPFKVKVSLQSKSFQPCSSERLVHASDQPSVCPSCSPL